MKPVTTIDTTKCPWCGKKKENPKDLECDECKEKEHVIFD